MQDWPAIQILKETYKQEDHQIVESLQAVECQRAYPRRLFAVSSCCHFLDSRFWSQLDSPLSLHGRLNIRMIGSQFHDMLALSVPQGQQCYTALGCKRELC